jgi:4-amino-4-deoxy-L-arabinose transferase-like glycosyltransferase
MNLRIFLLALIVRLLFIFPLSYSLSPDEATYVWGAKQILAGTFFPPTLERYEQSPLYVLFLAAHFGLFGENFLFVRLTQAVLGALTAVLTFALAKRMGKTCQVSREVNLTGFAGLAGLIVALYPDLIVLNGLLLTETLYTFLLVALILAWQIALDQSSLRWRMIAGALAGLALLTRTTVLAFLFLALAWDVFRARPHWRNGIARASIILAALMMVIAPWLARNWVAHETFFPPSYQFSWSLWASNHSGADGSMTLTPDMIAEEQRVQNLTMPERYAYFTTQAIVWIRAHPVEFIALALIKTSRFVGIKPDGMFRGSVFNKYIALVVPALTKGVLWLLVIIGGIFSARAWRRLGLIFAVILSSWLTIVVFSFYPRYLAPIIPVLAIIAAYGINPLRPSRFPKPRRSWSDPRARVALLALLVFALNAAWDVARNFSTLTAWQNLDTLSECDQAHSLSECSPVFPNK